MQNINKYVKVHNLKRIAVANIRQMSVKFELL